ncbi:MFS general substrate transporter [Mycena kentingensis (nom. inval.)]|nr:MFS general substrate transporter [Mycena kentingensis (nom. inval.)]
MKTAHKADSERESCDVEKHPAIQVLEIRTPPAPRFPDGGFAAWGTVLGSFLIMFCGFGYSSSFGVYQDFYVRSYLSNSSPSAISWIGSVNIFIVLSGGFVAGRLHDRGYFYPLMYTGALLMSTSLFLLSLARPGRLYQVFLTQGILNGLGAGMTYVPCMAVLSQHFSARRRALAMALVASGSSLGAVVHPIMLNKLLNSNSTNAPAAAVDFAFAVRASAGLVTALLTSIDLRKLLLKIGGDGAYMAATLGLGIYTIGFYYPLFYLQLCATQHGLDPRFAFYALVIMNASSFAGRLVPGFLTGRFPWATVPRMITVAAGCGAVLILCMIPLKDQTGVLVVGVLYGFFAGCIVTLMSPLLAALTAPEDMSELGARMGISVAACGLAILIGPPIDGLLLSGNGTESEFVWWRPALFSGLTRRPPLLQLTALAGFAIFILMLVLHARKQQQHKTARAPTLKLKLKLKKPSPIVVNVELGRCAPCADV